MADRAALSGWGRVAPTVADRAVLAAADVGAAVRGAGPRGVIARGLGRSYGDAAQNAGGAVLELRAASEPVVLDEDAATAVLDAGASLDAVLRDLVPRGWFVPVTPGTRHVTVGGAIAADIHGKNHHVDGSLGAHVVWLDLVDGTGAPRRLDPVGTPAEFWATVGGMGLTGVITRACVRVRRVESAWIRAETERLPNLDALLDRMSAGADTAPYSVAWIDLLARGASLGRGVLTTGAHASADELPRRARARPLAFDPRARVTAPPVVGRPVNPLTIRAFNEAWYRKAPRRPARQVVSMASFFHPLDGVRDWNRLYGRHGFVQYQFVVPDDAAAAVRESVERLSAAGQASFLAVVKRLGAANPAPLSFPLAGWTLALDLPASPGLAPLLDDLDALVADAGGRVYLAKDSRLRAGWLPRMYPRLEEFQAVRRTLDPAGVFRSDLARRLGL